MVTVWYSTCFGHRGRCGPLEAENTDAWEADRDIALFKVWCSILAYWKTVHNELSTEIRYWSLPLLPLPPPPSTPALGQCTFPSGDFLLLYSPFSVFTSSFLSLLGYFYLHLSLLSSITFICLRKGLEEEEIGPISLHCFLLHFWQISLR